MESNPFGLTLKSMDKAIKLGKDFARVLRCKSLKCLKQKVWGTIFLHENSNHECIVHPAHAHIEQNLTEVAEATEACLPKIIDYKQ